MSEAPVEDVVPLVDDPVADVESVAAGPPVAPVPAVTLLESIFLYEGLEGTRTLM